MSLQKVQKWFYRGGRPNRMARILNRLGAAVYALGIAPNYLVALEVAGRRSARIIRFPLVMVVVAGERYLVSMLGEEVNWVRNVKAAGGQRHPTSWSSRGGAPARSCGRSPCARAEGLLAASARCQSASAD